MEEPAPLAAHGYALSVLPASDIVPSVVAVSPPVEHVRNAARTTVVRHLTAAALMLAVIGAVAYWQLAVHAGQIKGAANSVRAVAATPSGVGEGAQPLQASLSASDASINGTGPTEPPARALALVDAPSRPLHPSIQPALTAPVFQAFATDEADQPPVATAAELSVALSDDPDAVWLVLSSVGSDQLLSLAAAPAAPSAGGTEPAAPLIDTAAVPSKPSGIPTVFAATPPPAADNGLAAAPVSRTKVREPSPMPARAAVQAIPSASLRQPRRHPRSHRNPARQRPNRCPRRRQTPRP